MIENETDTYRLINRGDGFRIIGFKTQIPDNLIELFNLEMANGLQLNTRTAPSLDFLIPVREEISLRSFSYETEFSSVDIEPLRLFPELQTLWLAGRTKGKLDFSLLPNLDDLAFDYRPPLKSYIDCHGLRSLCITGFPEKDLTRLEPMLHLDRLIISGGQLESLEGIENLKSLKHAEFMFCRKLVSLEGADKVPKGTQSPDGKYSNPTASKISVSACGQISKSTPLAEHVDLDAPL